MEGRRREEWKERDDGEGKYDEETIIGESIGAGNFI